MNESKKWYAVHTRPGREKKVTEILSRKKIENYCPLNRVARPWSEHKKIMHEPLFNFFAFIRVSDSEIADLEQANEIINFVYWLGERAVICNEEIETIKAFLKEHASVKLEKVDVRRDDIVISESADPDSEDLVQNLKNKSAKVVLPSLGYLMVAASETTNKAVIFRSLAPEITSQAG